MTNSYERGASLVVAILTWNDAIDARAAITSVLDISPGTPVVVLDNGSATPFEFAHPAVSVTRSAANLGVARGRNRLASLADSDALLFLDSDAKLLPGCLTALAQVLAEDAAIGLAAPVFAGQAPSRSAGNRPSVARKLARGMRLTRSYSWRGVGAARVRDVGFAIGACQLVRRSAFNQVGGYDERFVFGPEDVELCRRLWDSSWRVVQVEDARCLHEPRRAHRNPLSRRGLRHAIALARYYWHPRANG